MVTTTILITGGAGFIGSHLVDALVERGHRVRIFDSLVPQVHGESLPAHLNPKAEFIQADMNDRAALQKALKDVSVIFHKAAEVGVGQSMYEPERYIKANTLGTTILMDEVVKRREQIKKVVVASSMSIYGEGEYHCAKCGKVAPQLRSNEQLAAKDWEVKCPGCGGELKPIATSEAKPIYPTSVYAISKQDQEQLCLVMGRTYQVPTVALRYFNVYGTRQALSNPYTGLCAIVSARLLNDRAPLIFEDGEQSRDFVHVSDIVQANLLAMEKSDADYLPVNIGTGVPTTVNQVSDMIAEGLGKKIKGEIVGQYRQGDIRHCISDISRAKRLLGYSPKVALRDGIKELLGWVSKQTAVDKVDAATKELAQHKLVR